MNFGGEPPPRRKGKTKGKQKLNPEDVQEENPQLAEFLRQRRKAEARMNDAGDINHYLCVVFQSENQKNEFLDGLPEAVLILYNIFLDGEALAESLGIEGVTKNVQGPFQSPLNKRLTARTGIPDQGTDKIGNDYWGFGN